MREILFRGKPTERFKDFLVLRKEFCENGFVYGSLVVSNSRYYICVSSICSSKSSVNNGITTMVEVIPETVGQYTDLTDKNGTKIFEGDIVKAKDGLSNDILEICGYIDHKYGSFCIVGECVTHFRWLDYDVEVIGNIHDNPELLKGGAE